MAHRGRLAGQWEVTERPCPSLEAQAVEGGPTLEALGSVWTGLPGTQVYQSLAAASCVARAAEAAGPSRCVLAGCLVPAGAVCTAGVNLLLTVQPLEASGTVAEESARFAHTGTPVETRGRRTVVHGSLAVGTCVTWRAGAGVALRMDAAGATIETGP